MCIIIGGKIGLLFYLSFIISGNVASQYKQEFAKPK